MVLSAEIAAAIPHRGTCGLDQRGTQPSVAFARAPAAALAGALMVARADPRPGGGLRGRWEAPHVVPELGENLLGAAAADARDRIEPLNRWPKRARLLLDPLVEARDLLVEEFDVVQQPLEHEGVMQREAPDEGLAQRFRLLPECPARQVREPLGITFPGNEGVQHGAPGDAKDIGGDIAELDVGGLQHFLHSVGFAGVFPLPAGGSWELSGGGCRSCGPLRGRSTVGGPRPPPSPSRRAPGGCPAAGVPPACPPPMAGATVRGANVTPRS